MNAFRNSVLALKSIMNPKYLKKYTKWLTLLILILMLLAPWLFTMLGMVYLISMFTLIGIYTIVIMGLDLALGYGGQINLGLQGFMAIGAYTVAILTTKSWAPSILAQPLVAMVMGVLASLLVALAVSVPILRTMEKVPFSLAAIAFGLVIYFIVSGSAFFGSTLGITGIPPFSIGPLKFDSSIEMYYLIWIIVFLLLFFSLYIINSKWGLAIRCICSDDRTAEALGINVSKYRLEVFLLSAVFAGISGALFAFHMRGVDPTGFMFWMMLLFLFALYLGGERTIWGAMIGAIIIFLVIPESIDLISGFFPRIRHVSELIQGIIFVLILYFLPGGLFGLVRKIVAK